MKANRREVHRFTTREKRAYLHLGGFGQVYAKKKKKRKEKEKRASLLLIDLGAVGQHHEILIVIQD